MPRNVKLPSTNEGILFLQLYLGDRIMKEYQGKNCHYIIEAAGCSKPISITLNDKEIPKGTWVHILECAGIQYEEWAKLAGTARLFKQFKKRLKDAKRQAERGAE